jgi:hypothetical protein
MKILSLIILLFPLNFSSLAQDNVVKNFPRNTISTHFGGLLYGSMGIKYQRIFHEFENGKLGLGAGLGTWYYMDVLGNVDNNYGRKVDFSFQYLRGRERIFFDLEIGVVWNITTYAKPAYVEKLNPKFKPNFDYTYNLIPNLHIGYRYQAPHGFLFRVGAGTPEILKIALGISF